MWRYNRSYPNFDELRARAKTRIPAFAFEYLDGGCNDDVNLLKNTDDLRKVELKPRYIVPYNGSSLKTTLFGHTYDAPFGIAPVGLQGLIWPGAAEILAKAAKKHNIPFILSTVTTASIEEIARITDGDAWYQLYHPAKDEMRDDILRRLNEAGIKVLVLLCDVPSFGYRPRDIRNGLSMPPGMTFRNVMQIMSRPQWALKTLMHGQPAFATMQKYMPKGLSMKQLGEYMNQTFSGRLNESRIATMRDKWKGVLILKGVASEEDAEISYRLGLDGIIVSNHGGRQLDAAESSVHSLLPIAGKYSSRMTVMMDSGIKSGPDIARAMACGAEACFLGRSFMYAVAALGSEGGDHAAAILKAQLYQAMEQLSCGSPKAFKDHLIRKNLLSQ
jgi:L-lactate dehydrogenase (cytochrome)